MLDHTPSSYEAELKTYTEDFIANSDISNAALFTSEYLSGRSESSQFWVAGADTAGVVGCVGLKRVPGHRDEGEIVRMAVSPSFRRRGIGRQLVSNVVSFCEAEGGVLRITLSTANPASGSFYTRYCGFVAAQDSISETWLSLRLLRAVRYLGERVIRRIAIIGGTHGNERIGVELVNQWMRSPSAVARPTLEVGAAL